MMGGWVDGWVGGLVGWVGGLVGGVGGWMGALFGRLVLPAVLPPLPPDLPPHPTVHPTVHYWTVLIVSSRHDQKLTSTDPPHALAYRTVLIVSSRHDLLFHCMESLKALIFPLSWNHLYVPVMPMTMIDRLQVSGWVLS